MATISGSSDEKVFKIDKWLGLNESPDGDVNLKMGEAAVMVNFRVTRDGNLQKRPGALKMAELGDEPVQGMWSGTVGGTEYLVAACDSKLWKLWTAGSWILPVAIGAVSTVGPVTMFGYDGKLYVLDGSEYRVWDGTTYGTVTGYVPVVVTACPPAGGGITYEQINKLSAYRKVRFSPDGTSTLFQLPEKNLAAIDSVTDLTTGSAMTGWSGDTTNGTVSFTSPPALGNSTVEVLYHMTSGYRSQVTAMRYAETYNGANDNRVFLYGDGSNKAFYSGLDEDGKSRADYFPDLNVLDVGEANTPITGMIRQYSTLAVFKTNAAYYVQYGTLALEDGSVTAAFYTTPLNRDIGNAAPGQVRLVLNNPVTLHGNDAYEWRSTTVQDERNVKRISDRVAASLGKFDLSACVCWDDNDAQEYYICYNGSALVWNYAVDAWYYYDDLPVACMCSHQGKLYYGTPDGLVLELDASHVINDERAIEAVWQSGSMSFGKDFMRKSSAILWVGVKPESRSSVTVTIRTDRKAEYSEKIVTSSLGTFVHANFGGWSFLTNYRPQMHRLKLKAKKFVYYTLIFSNDSLDETATITAADIRVRFIGYAK